MNKEWLREYCLSLPHVEEDVKWGNDLCFLIGKKMFCVTGLEGSFGVSLKVKDDEFDELSNSDGIEPAAYVARYKWISIKDPRRFSEKEWKHYISQSYKLVRDKLPKKLRDSLSAALN